MNASPIDPELVNAQKKVDEIAAGLGPTQPGIEGTRLRGAAGRRWWNEGGPEMAERRVATVPGPYRDIPVILYKPTASKDLPVYVYLHGGGYRIGNEEWNDRQMREIADAWGGAVLSIDYAHVPEHTFPRAVEEAQAVFQWLHESGSTWGLDGTRIAFGGSSAGANVAVGAAIGLGGAKTGYLKAGATIAAIFDHDNDTDSMRAFESTYAPTRQGVVALLKDYLPDAAMWTDQRANPSLADATLFPPMFMAAAELDVLRDSSKNMAQTLAAAGRNPELKIYPGMTHMFFGFSRMVGRAQTCIADIAAFLRRHLPA